MMNFINNIIRFSLKNQLTVFLGVVLVIVGGFWSSQHMDIDVFPDLTAPTVVVMTDAHGMAAEEVERLVTFPIESEKMATLGETLPENITPQLAPQSSIMGEILLIGIQADSTSMMELRTLAEWTIKPAILATGGVSQVTIIGGDYKQYQILADPQRMDAYSITMGDLLRAGSTMSANSAGGVVRDFGNEYAEYCKHTRRII